MSEFDLQGRFVEFTDARGTLTTYEYDDPTGALLSMTQDSGGLDLVTDYQIDSQGRTTAVLGPAHDIDSSGSVRTVNWTVYLDDQLQIYTARGYLRGSDYTLVNPVTITQLDASGRVTDVIQAKRGSSVESSGASSASDTFAQSTWTRWTHNEYDDSGKLTSTRVYHSIPTSGNGSSGTNYAESDYGYDASGRQNRVASASGTTSSPTQTISRTVYDPRGLVLETWIGTNDAGATDTDPSGGGTSGNNMLRVSANTYDTNAYGSGSNSLDGLLTKVTSPVDSTSAHDRVVQYVYDWRDRPTTTITTDGTNVFDAVNTLDNQSRVTAVQTYREGGGAPTLIAQSQTFYDTRRRVYQAKQYAITGSGTTGNTLANNAWFDEEDHVLESLPAGAELFTKTVYDAIGRATDMYQGYYSGSGTETPQSITSDVIFEATHIAYDEASNAIFITTQQRWDSATGNGALNGPSGSQPKSRDSYTANWYDGINRPTQSADYGTNANAGASSRTLNASGTSPSDTVLVRTIAYNIRGETQDQTDPIGKVIRAVYDDRGQLTQTTDNYVSSPTAVVQMSYTLAGQIATLTAVNSDTGDQVTTYTYGVTTGGGSQLTSNDLLQMVTYPDSGQVSYHYNRQGNRTQLTDQNGSVHQYSYDLLGRQTADIVTTLGTDVDGAVRRIVRTYDNRTRPANVTSYDATSGGTVTSDVQYAYNDFSQVTAEYQQHGDAVDTSTSPVVEYNYASGSANTIRRTKIIYPDGRQLVYNYGSTNSASDLLSRVNQLTWDGTTVAQYAYLGLMSFVQTNYSQASVQWNLITGSGADPYAGLDLFGRTIDCLWQTTGGSPAALAELKYGYDQASNRLYRRDEVARSNSASFDELYTYDALERLASMTRGQLNSTNDMISVGPTLAQGWTLDATGNWKGFNQTVVDALTQSRAAQCRQRDQQYQPHGGSQLAHAGV